MTRMSKVLLTAAALTTIASTAFSQAPFAFNPGTAYVYSGRGSLTATAMASAPENHAAMMKAAQKISSNAIFFMHSGQMYMVSGTIDPTGNYYRQ
jgi:hypothetical protein